MNPELQKELMQRLDALTAKMGVTSEYLWETLVGQAFIEAMTSVVFVPIYVILVWFLFSRYIKIPVKSSRGGVEAVDDEFIGAIGRIFPGVLCLVLMVAALIRLEAMPTQLLNPEYWALKELLKALGG